MISYSKIGLILGCVVTFVACGSSEDAKEPVEEVVNTIPGFDPGQIDSSALACEDFYQFAIGNWLKDNPVPEAESRWGSFSVVWEENNEKLKTIVEEAASSDAKKGTPLQQVGDFYTAALDSTKADELGADPIMPYVEQINGITNVQELVEMMTSMRKNGSGSIFSYFVMQDIKNSSAYALYLSQGGLGLPDKGYYTPSDDRGKEILEKYELHIAALFKLIGQDEATAAENATKVVALETKLAAISMDRVDRRDPNKTYNKMAFDEVQKNYNNIDWTAFFKAAEVKPVEEIIVRQPDYIKGVNSLLASEDLEDWKTYMTWHLVNDFASSLSSDFEQQRFSFYSTTLSGVEKMKPRWKRALQKTNGSLGEPLGKLFVEKYFPEESKQKVLDMIDNIAAVFKERVQNLDWMSEETKLKALEKLSKFNYKIGYPDEWKDYSSIDVQPDALLSNVFNVNYYEYKDMVDRLGKEVDRKEWGMTPQTINAYYSPTMNEIVFPAAILQPPFFNPDADDAINYGGISGVIGHEFSHGFDDKGSLYDGEGNLNNWWTEEDKTKFKERTDKLVAQFNAFHVVDSVYVNGELTLGENIADLAGITLSYHALLKSYEGKEEPALIDGYNYKQRFFLGWAQAWHSNITDAEASRLAKVDPHSPTKYRVLGPLSNLPEFHEQFGCEHGNGMVSDDDKRVILW